MIKEFKIVTLRQWHDLYLKIDVYALADVFEYYRDLTYQTYNLEAAHYIGLPALSWDAGLSFTKVKLENISDVDMYMMFEKSKRGGISTISGRYSKANNRYIPDYDPNEKNNYLYQLDCNSLYGYSMQQTLPTHNIKWCNIFDEKIIETYQDSDEIGYMLEVDLDYPIELHNSHNDYPLAAEHLTINKIKKLCPNLYHKKNYILNINNLKYYIEEGLILKKIHKVISFYQSTWLASYINKNTVLRQNSKNLFEKDYYKLMNNSFYGKTMQNVRDYQNIKFCINEKQFTKAMNSPLFDNHVIILKEDGLIIVKQKQKIIKLNKPIYLGCCILESSKLLMYQFHYDTMKTVYPNSKMLKTDTDSLLYSIETEDLYADLKHNPILQSRIEFSNYPKDHFLFNESRKKIPGLFQDESTDGKFAIIQEYVGLRAKSYSNNLFFPVDSSCKDKKKSKGVPSTHIQNRINFTDYKDCLFNKKALALGDDNNSNPKHIDKIISFRSLNLVMYTIQQSKITLSGNDDKRHILENQIDTLALGNYRIVNKKEHK